MHTGFRYLILVVILLNVGTALSNPWAGRTKLEQRLRTMSPEERNVIHERITRMMEDRGFWNSKPFPKVKCYERKPIEAVIKKIPDCKMSMMEENLFYVDQYKDEIPFRTDNMALFADLLKPS